MNFLCSDLIKTDQVPWLKGNMNYQVLFLSQEMDSTLNFDDGTIANLPRTKAFKKDGRKPTAIFASSSVLV